MTFWKLGCRWGKNKPLFLNFITQEQIVIGVKTKKYNIGDLVLLTDGHTAIGVAQVIGPKSELSEFPEYENDFEENKIDWVEWVNIYKARIWCFSKQDNFPYKLQQGIVKINQEAIKEKLLGLYHCCPVN
ncbi:MAG: hypothetical protein JW875_02035 [Spirochaetales bacterium]|nr:hypothetical protein [Spirochaetales bacterium]